MICVVWPALTWTNNGLVVYGCVFRSSMSHGRVVVVFQRYPKTIDGLIVAYVTPLIDSFQDAEDSD